MVDINSFEAVIPFGKTFSYPDPLRKSIEQRRRDLDGSLFLDQLLDQLHITSGPKSKSQPQLYPPSNHDALLVLHNSISTANIATHHKQCLFYYILLDLESANITTSTSTKSSKPSTRRSRRSNESSASIQGTESTIAESFAISTHLPRKYRIVIEGLWAMDHGDYRTGCEALSQPALLPTFPEKVLSIMLKAATALSPESAYTLAGCGQDEIRAMTLAYWHSKSAHLANDESLLNGIFDLLASKSIRDGYKLLQTRRESQNETQRRAMFERLVDTALDPKGVTARIDESENAMRRSTRTGRAHNRSTSRQLSQIPSNGTTATTSNRGRAAAGLALVDLPLTKQESQWLDVYLSTGEGNNLPHAADTLQLRHIASNEAQRSFPSDDMEASGLSDSVSWGPVARGLTGGLDASVARAISEYDWES